MRLVGQMSWPCLSMSHQPRHTKAYIREQARPQLTLILQRSHQASNSERKRLTTHNRLTTCHDTMLQAPCIHSKQEERQLPRARNLPRWAKITNSLDVRWPASRKSESCVGVYSHLKKGWIDFQLMQLGSWDSHWQGLLNAV